jgi:pimeloyl-ACP methyl ester carboxylesterase
MPRSEALRLRAGEIELAATLTFPDGPAPPPAGHPNALLIASWLPRDRDGRWDRRRHADWFATNGSNEAGLLARSAAALAAHGVASLRYDKRGCGESGGRWEEADLFQLIDDARDALGHLRGRDEVDIARTAVIGHGEGAGIALSVAIGDPAVGALGLIGSGARSFRDLLRRAVAERARRGEGREHPLIAALDRGAEELIERAGRHEPSIRLSVAGKAVDVRLAGWRQAFATPPFALATMLHRPVILIHGRTDSWTSSDESRLLVEALRRGGNEPGLTLVDAGHELADAPDATIDAFAAELAACLAEPRPLPPALLATLDGQP